jgi:GNAT superfamily N-acetyltransferase
MARRPTLGWGHPTAGWAQAFPGWDPLPDAGSLPLRAARSLARWWWPISAIVGFLAVVAYVLTRDPQPGLSSRGWLTVVLAAVVVATLSVRRSRGIGRAPLARALAEYAVVALLAVLLATTEAGQQPAPTPEDAAGRRPPTEQPTDRRPPAGQPADRASADAGATADRRLGIVRVVSGVWGWLAELWRDAGELADRRSSPPSTTTPTPTARALPAPSTWRSSA